jgi:hypothetical protein
MSNIFNTSDIEYLYTNVPISELERMYKINDKDLLLISKYTNPDYETKVIQYKHLLYDISSEFEIQDIKN